jgi:protein AFG1
MLFNQAPTIDVPPLHPPKGLYLHGTVGTGKSMLMDLFHSTLPLHLHTRRRRAHFHAFMIDVHKRLHKLKSGEAGVGGVKDPILYVARDLANESFVLCFDEFQVPSLLRHCLS